MKRLLSLFAFGAIICSVLVQPCFANGMPAPSNPDYRAYYHIPPERTYNYSNHHKYRMYNPMQRVNVVYHDTMNIRNNNRRMTNIHTPPPPPPRSINHNNHVQNTSFYKPAYPKPSYFASSYYHNGTNRTYSSFVPSGSRIGVSFH